MFFLFYMHFFLTYLKFCAKTNQPNSKRRNLVKNQKVYMKLETLEAWSEWADKNHTRPRYRAFKAEIDEFIEERKKLKNGDKIYPMEYLNHFCTDDLLTVMREMWTGGDIDREKRLFALRVCEDVTHMLRDKEVALLEEIRKLKGKPADWAWFKRTRNNLKNRLKNAPVSYNGYAGCMVKHLLLSHNPRIKAVWPFEDDEAMFFFHLDEVKTLFQLITSLDEKETEKIHIKYMEEIFKNG